MKEGDIVWYLRSVDNIEGACKCLHKGYQISYGPNREPGFSKTRYQLQYIREDGQLGMSFGAQIEKVFSSLDELKEAVDEILDNTISDIKFELNKIIATKKQFSELKDIQEDREKKLDEILR